MSVPVLVAGCGDDKPAATTTTLASASTAAAAGTTASTAAAAGTTATAAGGTTVTAATATVSADGVKTIEITLSDDGCEPRSIAATAGPTTFKITNDGSAAVTEFEVLSGTKILGEVENVIPGADRSFSLTLAAGSYTTKCPGGEKFEAGTLEVADAASGQAADKTARDAAVATYIAYVTSQADKLITVTDTFVAAVAKGDLDAARAQFAAARYPYEAIEPIAESFGDLDPAIDAREGDVAADTWGGFHRLEKAMWVDNSLTGMGTVADGLAANVKKLRTQIGTLTLEPAQIANGAVELLNEVSTSKITGEEDRYSHTDLSDFAGNLAGAKAAFEALKPLIATREASLVTDLEARFAAVQAALDAYKGTDPVFNGYKSFTDLTTADTRALSTVVDALAEPLSRVAALVLV